ncbi:MAG: type II toxin-antitoxin system VapC family toxin [Spirulinaceae cyanobacterium]
MPQPILIDAGPLVAILSTQDDAHQLCVDTLKQLTPPLLTCWAVLTEVHWLLKRNKPAVRTLFTMIEGGLLQVVHLPVEATPWLRRYLLKYHDIGAQLADVSLCYLAETRNVNTIFTLDRRDFSIYRLKGNQVLKIIPA